MGFSRHKLLFNDQVFTSRERWSLATDRISIEDKFFESGRSSVFTDETNFYKLIKTKNYIRSNYRLLLGKSRATDEVLGNQKLGELGLLVPELKYHGTSLFAKHHNEILVFEKLNHVITVKAAIKNQNDFNFTKDLLFKVVQQLNLLIRSGILFRDFHFNNVMINPEGDLYWVDTAVSIVKNKEQMEYGINKKIRSLNRQVANERWLCENNWNFFKKNIDLAIDSVK